MTGQSAKLYAPLPGRPGSWFFGVNPVLGRFRRRHVDLEEGHGLELVVLLAATVYAFWLPFKGELTLLDMGVLVTMFVFYMWRIARLPAEEPHLVGPAAEIGRLSPRFRRTIAALTDRRAPTIRIARGVVYPLAFAAQAFARFTNNEPFITVEGLRLSKYRMFFTAAKAERELGIRPRPYSEGLRDAIDWFRHQRYIT